MKIEDLTQEKLDELLGNLETLTETQKALKSDLTKLRAKAKGADIDPELHAALQTENEELKGKLAKVEKESKTQIEKLSSQLQEKDGAVSKYLVDSNLSDALAKVGVLPHFMDAAKSLLKSQATIKAENGEYQALIGDKPITDAIKEWASSETGKYFVKAPDNSGGGGQGNGSNGNNQIKGKIDGTPAERAEYFASKYPDLQKE
jgi:alanyl-tRNA synthetase